MTRPRGRVDPESVPRLRALEPRDPQVFEAAFQAIGWRKRAAKYQRYLEQQASGERDVVVAEMAGEFAGYLTICWTSRYPAFRQRGVPEIEDLNVLPRWRRRHVATHMLDEAEARIAARSPFAGIGVGMTADYGPAQRLYVARGYIPDGRGLTHARRGLVHGERVVVDDALVLYLERRLRPGD